MSYKELLGLGSTSIPEHEIMLRVKDALVNGLDEIEFIDESGQKTLVRLPHLSYDPFMYVDVS